MKQILDTKPFAEAIPGVKIISVFNINEDCKTEPQPGRRNLILYTESKAVVSVYLVSTNSTDPIGSYTNFSLSDLPRQINNQSSTFPTYAQSCGLNDQELRNLILQNAPKAP